MLCSNLLLRFFRNRHVRGQGGAEWGTVDDGLRAATRREAKTKCVSTGYLRLSPAPRTPFLQPPRGQATRDTPPPPPILS